MFHHYYYLLVVIFQKFFERLNLDPLYFFAKELPLRFLLPQRCEGID